MKEVAFKRWYDRQPRLASAVTLSVLLPEEVQRMIGEALVLIEDRERMLHTQDSTCKTLGSEKIMGIHKSKNKRREYDQNETLHKAMNCLYILSDDNQDLMADHILSMIDYIRQYFAACQEFKVSPSMEEVADL